MTVPITAASILNELAAIHDFLTAAQEIIRMGHMPDISALEKRVADACMVLEKSADDVRTQCLPELKNLLAHLDECASDIKAWKDQQTE